MKFECSKCGLCCRSIGLALNQKYEAEWIQKAVDEFPFEALPDGSCPQLTAFNRCAIYEDRPLLCDIERAADECDINMSKAEWFKLNAKGCNRMMDDAGLPADKRVTEDYE